MLPAVSQIAASGEMSFEISHGKYGSLCRSLSPRCPSSFLTFVLFYLPNLRDNIPLHFLLISLPLLCFLVKLLVFDIRFSHPSNNLEKKNIVVG